jgi:hypothetical protein
VKINIEIELDMSHIDGGTELEVDSQRMLETEDFVEILEKVAGLSSSLVSFDSTIE